MNQRISPINALSSLLRNYFYAIVIAAIAAFAVRMYVAEAFKIPTDFMAPTLVPGDHIFVNKLAFIGKSPVARGNVVVFSFPNDPRKEFIKRVVGIAGDTVSIQDGGVILNGKRISEKSIAKSTRELLVFDENLDGTVYQTQWISNSGTSTDNNGLNMMPISVPAGKVFMLGDFRSKGQDSRSWGFIDVGLIKAKAIFVWLSIGDSIRWDRMFTGIH